MGAGVIDRFVENALRLVELERRAEVEETARLQRALSPAELERRGVSLLGLKIADELAGLGGRVLLVLERAGGGELPAHRFQPGDIVALRTASASPASSSGLDAPTGVAYRVGTRSLTVALDELPEERLDPPLRIDRVANDITYRRLREALERLRAYGRGAAARLREVLFGLREPVMDAPRPFAPFDAALDASQREAVALAMAARDFALIHGPPGTGKTTAAVEVILQAVARGEKVLACAPSNIAADNLAERLIRAGRRVVRLGHPARLLPGVVEHSLDAVVERSEGSKVAAGLRRELEGERRRLRRSADRAERRRLRDGLRRLREELRELEERTVRSVLAGADVVLATNTGAGERLLAGFEFDLVVIDEAAQAIEASSWIPLLKGRRAVLAGDHRQLPPTIRSLEAERAGLGVTLFDRLAAKHGERASRMLEIQYRMHERIMEWSSREFYAGRLVAHESVREHLLCDLPAVEPTAETRLPLLFIDTAGCDLEEEEEPEGDSKANPGEAQIVGAHVSKLIASGLEAAAIGVITPYNAQVACLRGLLHPEHPALEIDSVDGFQGREKEAIVLSMVRSNRRGEVGFLADERRANVAATRARRHLAIAGDSATLASSPFLRRLIEHCEKRGEYRSAWEYL
jgi:ATP-dependent RNA/DNA helicase IGHMBP2